MNNDKKEDMEIHDLPESGMLDIHKSYGLWIITGGTRKTRENSFYFCKKRYFNYYSISHMFSGVGMMWLESGQLLPVQAGDCVIVTPKICNRYGGVDGKHYEEDNIVFWGPVADMLMQSGILSSGVIPWGKLRRLRTIAEYASDPAAASQIRANIELQRFIIDLYMNKIQSRQNDYPLLDDLLKEIRENPQKWWSVREMAELCNLSIDQMRRVFFQRTGVTPKLYIDRIKLQKAAEYLVSTRCSIARAAELFGYRDQYHFSRRFKAVLGTTPSRYRLVSGAHPAEEEN